MGKKARGECTCGARIHSSWGKPPLRRTRQGREKTGQKNPAPAKTFEKHRRGKRQKWVLRYPCGQEEKKARHASIKKGQTLHMREGRRTASSVNRAPETKENVHVKEKEGTPWRGRSGQEPKNGGKRENAKNEKRGGWCNGCLQCKLQGERTMQGRG